VLGTAAPWRNQYGNKMTSVVSDNDATDAELRAKPVGKLAFVQSRSKKALTDSAFMG
jgi:hypothetical protein